MLLPRTRGPRRRGKFLVMSALLLPALLGGMALSVDYGVLATAQGQLRTAAYAAALAGARKLVDETRLAYSANLTTQMAAARAQATAVATANHVLGAAPVVFGGDIAIGYIDPAQPGTGLTTAVSPTLFNAVQVTLARDSTHGGVVPTFFAGALGRRNGATRVQATALISLYTIRGFRSTPGRNSSILPIALDSQTYQKMLTTNGRTGSITSDRYRYDPATGQVSSGQDGVYESSSFPITVGSPGNWATLTIGLSSNSASELEAQILNGITPTQLNRLGGTLQLNPQTGTLSLPGNPGISSTIQDALTSIIGQTRAMPVYTQVTNSGSNSTYTITGFAGVRVMGVDFKGSPKYVVVQPASLVDLTAIPGTATSWTSGGALGVHLAQ